MTNLLTIVFPFWFPMYLFLGLSLVNFSLLKFSQWHQQIQRRDDEKLMLELRRWSLWTGGIAYREEISELERVLSNKTYRR